VPILDDENFEAHLKQFRPLVPEPLPIAESRHRARGRLVLWTAAAAIAAILIASAVLQIHRQRVRIAERNTSPATSDRLTDGPPLTMRSANALMAKAPSFKALVDDMAFRSQTVPLPAGTRSAVAVLGEENMKL
jgi:hypothetical protein